MLHLLDPRIKHCASRLIEITQSPTEPFINDQKEIKAFVLRTTSEQEKKMMMRMSAPEAVDLANESIPADLSLRT